jgi:hypothetical protein
MARAGTPLPGRQRAIHSVSAPFTASGRSMVERCPQSATTTSRDPAMAAAISRDSGGGVSSSPSPTSTRVRTGDRGQDWPDIRPRHDRLLLAQEGLRTSFVGHRPHPRSERRVVLAVAMNEDWKLQRRNFVEATALREHDLRLASLALLRRLGSR